MMCSSFIGHGFGDAIQLFLRRMNLLPFPRSICACALLFTSVVCIAAESGQPGNLTVNGKAIPAERIESMVKNAVAAGKEDNEALRKQVTDVLISQEILLQEVAKRQIAQRPEVIRDLEQVQQAFLIRAMVVDVANTMQVSDEDLNKAFELKLQQLPKTDYLAHHILCDTEVEAKQVLAKLKKHQNFEELAKSSKDINSASNGGKLDWAPAEAYVPEFAQALRTMKTGEISRVPVHTQFGYHVLRLDDVRPHVPPTLDSIKAELSAQIRQEKAKAYIADLQTNAKVDRPDNNPSLQSKAP